MAIRLRVRSRSGPPAGLGETSRAAAGAGRAREARGGSGGGRESAAGGEAGAIMAELSPRLSAWPSWIAWFAVGVSGPCPEVLPVPPQGSISALRRLGLR